MPLCLFASTFVHFVCLIYSQTLEFENETDLPGKYEIQCLDTSTAVFHVEHPTGIITPNASVQVPFTFRAKTCGPISVNVKIVIVGSLDPPLVAAITCVGEGAVVSVAPAALDWGRVRLLQDVPRTIKLTNESVIPASFKCSIEPAHSIFSCDVTAGSIAPGLSANITLHTFPNDTTAYSASLKITNDNAAMPSHVIPLALVGYGPCVVASPDMSLVDFGNQFSRRECERVFEVRNMGVRVQKLVFVLDSPPPNTMGQCTVMRGATFKKTKTPVCPNPPDPERSVFGVWPEKLVLRPGESGTCVLKGLTNKAMVRSLV